MEKERRKKVEEKQGAVKQDAKEDLKAVARCGLKFIKINWRKRTWLKMMKNLKMRKNLKIMMIVMENKKVYKQFFYNCLW